MDPRERAPRMEDEDAPLSKGQLEAFHASLERARETRGFATGHNASPEAEARRRFFEELDAEDI